MSEKNEKSGLGYQVVREWVYVEDELNDYLVRTCGKRWDLVVRFVGAIIYLFCGAAFYHYYEGWGFINCVYFAIVSG